MKLGADGCAFGGGVNNFRGVGFRVLGIRVQGLGFRVRGLRRGPSLGIDLSLGFGV